MTARLSPIENPESPLMKLAYWFTKKMFGKVISPLKLIHARLPFSFLNWSRKIQSLEKQLAIPPDLALLVKIHVAQLNGCGFCIDIAKAQAIGKFDRQERFFSVNSFEESPLFSRQEQLALRFATELTRHKQVSDETYGRCQEHFSDKALISIAWVVAVEHYYNILNGAFAIESDGLCTLPEQQHSSKPFKGQLQ
ncbi:carboxymuconolactone decarboxylase family protein [Cesiribacter sp. SM1]|uniref:carboxymuconolactone decarboxylase family protein n=1 Tax=Cesiribacter sp. SM1 TaxID=2861196 RepID=UPI001CD62292|nr:carboxymuconolactone decarboxylase family protein [Cesiribacter sp. SM1]